MSNENSTMTLQERHAQVESYLGKTVTIEIDRPIGYEHHKGSKTLLYPINYGFIPGVLGGDGEELDVFLLGVDEPVSTYTGRIVGIVYRADDVEDKLVMAPAGMAFSAEEIARAVYFQEKYYQTTIRDLDGAMVAIKECDDAG
jgi:inorganic pyrophosphatase